MKIPPSSTVMIHSSLLKFGIIENGIKGLLKCIVESLAGDTTILMPAFTFGFSESRYWSAKNTKSEMGALTEFFRKQEGTIRTLHPFHSVVAYGTHAKDFSTCNSLSSFGRGSPFEKLLELDALICHWELSSLGVQLLYITQKRFAKYHIDIIRNFWGRFMI